ncbi:MAG: MarR family winged helix-turn-helix transcriptional regulator [Nocardioides sp.]|uniref:MarR family winged helix-turn-helix transcriptional regulator n=1 Tax=Nocardioides sp. TaxID=35761 RepID=UPI003F003D99
MEQVTARIRASRAWGVAVATARLERASRIVESRLNLGTADMRLLWLLADGDSRTMKEISHELRLEASTVNRQVNAALKAGLVERCDREGAARPVRATEKGLAYFTSDVGRAMRLMNAGLDAIPEDQVAGFLDNLRTYADAYREAAEGMLEVEASVGGTRG